MKHLIRRTIVVSFLISMIVFPMFAGGQTDSQASETQSSDDTFLYISQQLVNTIDPAKAKDETEIITAVNLYDPLFYPDVANNSMDPAPHIASGYTVSDDGMVYTMTIRDDVTFQSGNKLSAADVAYSMERMIAINQGNAWLWSTNLESVEATDAKTVVFTLKSPYAPFISSLTQLYIVDSALLKANQAAGDFGANGDYGQAYIAEHSAGSGPYILSDWNRQSYLDFTAFEGYWKGWRADQIKKARMQTIMEEATVKTLLVSGQADMVHMWLAVSAFNDMAKSPDVKVISDPSAKLQYFPMNTKKAPTDDINVRKAIAAAFDYTSCQQDILGGARPAAGFVPTVVPGHADSVKPQVQDIEMAKQYLAQSKYAGQDISVTFMYLADTVEQRQFSQLITANLQAIGIKVVPKPVTWAQVTQAASSVETTANLTVISDSLKYPHVDSHTYGIWHSSTAGSYRTMHWAATPEIDKVLEDARKATDPAQQMALYEKSQEMATALVPGVFIANPTHRIAMRTNVEGYKYVGLMGYDVSFYSLSVK